LIRDYTCVAHMSVGYSGTPLARKLGIKPGHVGGHVQRTLHFPDLPEPLSEDVGVEVEPAAGIELDLAVIFVIDKGKLRVRFLDIAKRIRTNGGLWVSWPEKSSPLATELRNSHVRDAGLRAGLVDQGWSGLRFVYRLTDR